MPFFIILLIGTLIRLLLVGNPGFIADIAFWKSWSLGAIDHGIVWTAFNTNINYPPGFIYVLWIMGKIYTLFGNPHNFNDFWRENNFGFLLASKSIAIFSDIAIAVLIYWFFSQKKKLKELGASLDLKMGGPKEGIPTARTQSAEPRGALTGGIMRDRTHKLWESLINNLPLILSALFFFHPVVILDSALWGQVESFGLLFTLVAIILILYKKPMLASFVFIMGTQMKLQNIIFIPLFFIFIWRYFDFKILVKSLGAAAFSFFLVNLPFVITGNMTRVLTLLTTNSDYFPLLSLNAHNLWWIVAGGDGMGISDKITVLGILNAKTTGLILFSSCYLLSVILVYKKPSPKNLFLSLSFAIFSFFLWTTQSHERYSYPVLVLLLFFYPFVGNLKLKTWFWILYILLSLSVFLNIHTGLIVNYPENGWDILTFLTRGNAGGIGIVNSIIMIGLFFSFIPFIFGEISSLFGLLCMGALTGGIILLNAPYVFGNSYPLTKLKPISIRQDYGILQVGKSVNSYTGWKAWNRLGSDYFYYDSGFGTHANSDLVFDIQEKFTRFSTDYGVNTEAGTDASVIFIIKGDGKEIFKSKKMGRFDFPEHIAVDISGVKRLELAVTDAGDGISNDHADWLNPVLIK